ncbi:MAG: SagB/ThcOx family dehydrogenase [Rhodocyclaceae bacterium]|nr:SagB/ThcOx family dehydrogenase [Rhodocyclaceae bacterium]
MDTTIAPPSHTRTDPPGHPGDAVLAYHLATSHRFDRYARGPETLDWDAQPAAFRSYPGSPARPLPLIDDLLDGRTDDPLRAALQRPFDALSTSPPVPVTIASLGALLQLACGLTAWKTLGPDRWALRANPSSGNLHPVECWLVSEGIDPLSDGVHHYRPEDHALELRASDRQAAGASRLHIALSTAMWREAWKYGERAFRYCQLDVGHTVGALRYAAAVLGWTLHSESGVDGASLATRLGLDRHADYPARREAATEREEAELVLALGAPGLVAGADPVRWRDRAASADWHGRASELDPRPFYRWPAVDAIARATRPPAAPPEAPKPSAPPPGRQRRREAGAVELILGRRSAQRYDAGFVMPRKSLVRLINALMRRGAPPADALPASTELDLLLIIHRVRGIEPGVYLLPRASDDGLRQHLAQRHPRLLLPGPIAGSPLRCLATLAPARLAEIARRLHCHQAIAADACLAIAFVAPLEQGLSGHPERYRTLHRAAGLLGQQLYLEAGAEGLAGTGIGCFFDGPVRQFHGLDDSPWHTVYHFAIGMALHDQRIGTEPAYGADRLARFSQEDTP